MQALFSDFIGAITLQALGGLSGGETTGCGLQFIEDCRPIALLDFGQGWHVLIHLSL